MYDPGNPPHFFFLKHRPRWRVALVMPAGYSRADVSTFWSTFQVSM